MKIQSHTSNYLTPKEVNGMKAWLAANGSEVIKSNTEWELLRFGCRKGVATIYINAKQQQSHSHKWIEQVIAHYRKNRQWDGHGPTEKPAKKTGNARHLGFKKQLLKRDGDLCFFCQLPAVLTVEHLVPKVEGGPNRMSNLALACEDCQIAVGSKCVADKIRYRDKMIAMKDKASKEARRES